MSTNHTPNYALSQWSKDDRVLMDDFNADNAKIDAALTELQSSALRLYCGSYTGTGTKELSFAVPFKPKVMWIQKSFGVDERLLMLGETSAFTFQSLNDGPWCKPRNDGHTITLTDTSVKIKTFVVNAVGQDALLNQRNTPYIFLLLG